MSENEVSRKVVTKKRVNLRCNRPFRIGFTPFSGNCPNIVLNVKDIATIISEKSMVEEVLSTGETVPLNFSNYNTYNGLTDVTDDTPALTDIESYRPQPIRTFDADGKEIYKSNKRRFGGGFRKDPRTTGQIPGYHAVSKVEPRDTDKEIVITDNKTYVGLSDNPDVVISENIVISKPDQEDKKETSNTDSSTTIIIDNEKKNNNTEVKPTENTTVINVENVSDTKTNKDSSIHYSTDTKEVKIESIFNTNDTMKNTEKKVVDEKVLQINTIVSTTEKSVTNVNIDSTENKVDNTNKKYNTNMNNNQSYSNNKKKK